MAGRYILTNIVQLLQIMEEVDAKKTQAIVMSIDFQKCFDMIDYTAIKGSMKYFGFGDTFINHTMLLFDDFQFCTQNNGHISAWIRPS